MFYILKIPQVLVLDKKFKIGYKLQNIFDLSWFECFYIIKNNHPKQISKKKNMDQG